MKQKIKLWQVTLLALIVLLSGGLFFVHYQNSHNLSTSQVKKQSHQQIAEKQNDQQIEEAGIMTVADHNRLTSIHDNVEKTGSISNDDFNWVITLLQSKPLKDTDFSRAMKPSSVMLYMGHLEKLSPAQKQKLYNALLPYLSNGSSPLKQMAMRILGDAKVSSAKPVLTQLLHDNSAGVREGAKRALQKIDS